MANGLPEYQQRVQLGDGPSPALRGEPMPSLPDATAGWNALSGLGKELGAVAQKLEDGQQHTAASQGMEQFIVGNAKLKQEGIDSPDYANAPRDYADKSAALQRDSLANISDPQLRARTSLEMTRLATTSGNDVRTAQVKREGDINIAANDTLTQSAINDAVTAKSPQERQAAIDRVSSDLERLHGAGWIDGQTAVARFKSFAGQLDQADALKLANDNPAAAIAALRNKDMFTSLDPVRRESLLIAAQGKLDGNNQAAIVQAAQFHPEAASLALGRVTQPDHAAKIYDNGILAIETNNDNSAVSPKGAMGRAQLMPDTAREMAAAVGRKDIAGLNDADLKKELTGNEALNIQLGRAYWDQLVKRYDGNVALAAAAYNGGPGRADVWKAAAEAKYGAGFSPGELASVIDVKETRDYLGKLYARFNAPMDAQFSSPGAAQNAITAVGAVLTQQDVREKHLLSVQATASNASDPIADIVKAGFDVDPQRLANYKAMQTAAASKGDQAALGRLRDLDFAEKSQPFVRQAWGMSPALLDDGIKTLEGQMSAPGANVTQSGLNMLAAFKAVRDDQVKRRDSEPVTLGGANGARYYNLAPVDPNGALDDNLVGALKARDAQAMTAHRIYGGSGSPFTAQEAEGWHQRYADATPADRAAIVGQLAKGLSPQTFAAALPQVVSGTNAKSDRPGVAMAAGLFGQAPDIAASILQGIDAQKTDAKYVPAGTSKQVYDTARATALPAAAFNVAARTDPRGPYASMQDAIDARYAFLSAQAKDTSGNLNSSRLKQAAEDITGGVLSHNGAPVLAPARDMTQGQFDGVLFGLKDDDLKGAQTTGGKAITADYLRGSAKLVARSDGQYYLQVNRDDDKPQYAVAAAGGPFVLDLRGRKPVAVPNAAPIVFGGT